MLHESIEYLAHGPCVHQLSGGVNYFLHRHLENLNRIAGAAWIELGSRQDPANPRVFLAKAKAVHGPCVQAGAVGPQEDFPPWLMPVNDVLGVFLGRKIIFPLPAPLKEVLGRFCRGSTR